VESLHRIGVVEYPGGDEAVDFGSLQPSFHASGIVHAFEYYYPSDQVHCQHQSLVWVVVVMPVYHPR